jgi:hypothetical protein
MSKSHPRTNELIGKHTEDLSCDLTQSEVLERGRRMAQVDGEIDAHTSHEINVKADLKATRARLEAERSKLSACVRSGTEARPVEVEHLADFEAGVVKEIRIDTGKLIRSRVLLSTERQLALPEPAQA